MEYINPILKGFNPDPSICFDGDSYYIVCSSFEFFPCLPVYKSKDLINWDLFNYVVEDSSFLDFLGIKNSMGLFAPTIRFNNGTFFVVCTNISQGNFICFSDDISKGWSKPIWIECPMGIDPSITFIGTDCYYQLSVFSKENNSIIQFKIDPRTGEVLSSPKEISQGCGGRDVEAPHVFKKGDWFYLVLAEGGTREGHMVTIQRSKNINGPFEGCPYNPILSNRNVKSSLQSVGHGDFIEDRFGNWWIVALATRPIKHYTLLGRETILLPVEWENNWPIVNKDGIATEIVNIDREGLSQLQSSKVNYFNKDNVKSIRFSIEYSLYDNLILNNLPYSLGETSNYPISYLSISQKDYEFTCSTDCNPQKCTIGDFGLSIYKDDNHFFEVGFKREINGFKVFVKKTVDDIKLIDINEKLFSFESNISLEISGEQQYYLCTIKMQDDILLEETILTKHFTNEVSSSPFTGVQIGFFSKASEGETEFIDARVEY